MDTELQRSSNVIITVPLDCFGESTAHVRRRGSSAVCQRLYRSLGRAKGAEGRPWERQQSQGQREPSGLAVTWWERSAQQSGWSEVTPVITFSRFFSVERPEKKYQGQYPKQSWIQSAGAKSHCQLTALSVTCTEQAKSAPGVHWLVSYLNKTKRWYAPAKAKE